MAREKAKKAKYRAGAHSEQKYRRMFAIVGCVAVAVVLLGLGPVWLSAEATRAAKQSELLQEKIAATLSRSEELELRRAALMTSPRVERFAVQQLAMVPADDDPMFVTLSTAEMAAEARAENARAEAQALALAQSGTAPSEGTDASSGVTAPTGTSAATTTPAVVVPTAATPRAVLRMLAQLTAGEASTLLVGDVGLASLR
ncbi:MAG: hypothetical protein LBJ07_02500 [Actinomycetes bacterium]|nr:hypothetical protein [Actinomycetes bacterium]